MGHLDGNKFQNWMGWENVIFLVALTYKVLPQGLAQYFSDLDLFLQKMVVSPPPTHDASETII